MLDQILEWGKREKGVRVLLLVGSRGNGRNMDELSDYDISVFGDGFEFIHDDEWLKQIGSPIVCIHEKFQWGDFQIPTRLTIFEKWLKVDFAFHPLDLLRQMVDNQHLQETYDAGFKVLLDKEGLTAHLPKPQFKAYILAKPDQECFAMAQREFWFEAWHVAKYLYRKDPWVAKFREDAMKKWLLKMLEWNAAVKMNFTSSFKTDGQGIGKWADPKYFNRLGDCFPGWNFADRASALYDSMELFRDAGTEAAKLMEYEWLHKSEKDIRSEINQLIPYQHEQSKT